MTIQGDFKHVSTGAYVGTLTGWPAVPRIGELVILPTGRWKVLQVIWEDMGDNGGVRIVAIVERMGP